MWSVSDVVFVTHCCLTDRWERMLEYEVTDYTVRTVTVTTTVGEVSGLLRTYTQLLTLQYRLSQLDDYIHSVRAC